MEVILQIITGVVVTFLSAVVLRMQDEAKKVQQQREAETKKRDDDFLAIKEGLCSLLNDRIDQAHERYTMQGYMPVEKRYKFHRIYNAYHALGGNGICTDLMKKLEKLPTSPQGEMQGCGVVLSDVG